jgi:hypothetical protein
VFAQSTNEMYHSLETSVSAQTLGDVRGACTFSVEGLASLVTGEVPQELDARPVDGLPELAPTVKRLYPKGETN